MSSRLLDDVCCRASAKEDCTWPPCPCNFDVYTPAELATFNHYDTHRTDQALMIFTGRQAIER